MATITGIVKGLEGKFFAKDADGNIVELQNGDRISSEMIVFGDSSNSASAQIEVAMLGSNEVITVSGTGEQAFDASVNADKDDLEEVALAEENVNGSEGILAALEDEATGKNVDAVDDEETAAGEDSAGTKDGREGEFADRDASATDIVAGLRDAQFTDTPDVQTPLGELFFGEFSIDGGIVDEDAILGIETTDDDGFTTQRVATGDITIIGASDVYFTAGQTTGLTSRGEPITMTTSADGQTLTGTAGGREVFIATLADDDGSYRFELVDAIDHSDATSEDSETLSIGVGAINAAGSTREGSFNIIIADDVPEIDVIVTDDSEVDIVVDESDFDVDANSEANLSGIFKEVHNDGADGATIETTYVLGITSSESGLTDTQSGNPITLSISQNGLVVTGSVETGNGTATVFTITTDNNGNVILDQTDRAIQHPDTGDHNDSVDLNGLVTLARTDVITDGDGDTATDTEVLNIGSKLSFLDDGPSISENATVQLDDDTLTGGIAGGIDDDTEDTTLTGTLAHDYGADAEGTVLLTGIAPNTGGFTSVVSLDGTVLTISQGGVEVVKVTLDDTTSGGYTVEQLAAVTHPIGNDENNLDFDIQYKVTDGDGDTDTTGSMNINVDDDTPTITTNELPLTFELVITNHDSASSAGYHNSFGYYVKDANGNPTVGKVVWDDVHDNDTVPVTVEGYTPDEIGFFLIPNGDNKNPLLTDDTDVVFVQDPQTGDWQAHIALPDGTPGIALVGQNTNAPVLFDNSTLNYDADAGAYVYMVDTNLAGNLNWEDIAGGGDRDNNDVNVNADWTQTGPLGVDESDLNKDATFDFGNSGAFNFDFGSDGAAASDAVEYNLNLTAGSTGLFDTATNQEVVLATTTDGIKGIITINENGTDVDYTVFTLTMIDGVATLNQVRSVVHPDASDNDDTVGINAGLISLDATITDGDGDTATSGIDVGSMISFDDDGPIAFNDNGGTAREDVASSQIVEGNVMNNDLEGADTDTTVTSYDSQGTYGSVVIAADGTYTYTLANSSTTVQDLDEGQKVYDVFEYTITDADGDTSTATLTIPVIGQLENTTTAIDDYGIEVSAQGEFDVTEAIGTDGGQSQPDTAALKDGGYVIAWTEENGSSYNGAEVNDANNNGVNDSGEVVWATRQNHDVFVQRYDVDGEKVGEATLVNTFVTNVNAEGGRSQHDVNVIGLENGNYLVTWTSDDHYIDSDNWDNGSRYVQGQIFDANGNHQCEEFTVSRAEYDPLVALPDGGFIVTWSADARYDNTDQGAIDNPIYSDTQDGSGFAVIAQRFDALGNEVGDRLIVNTTTQDDQIDSDIVMLADGTALMTWQSQNGTDGDYDIYAQKLVITANGLEKSGAEIAVSTTAANETDPEITAFGDGSAIISYESDGAIITQTISATGTVGSPETITTSGENPVITPLGNGFIIVYEDGGAIYSKIFDGTSLSDAVQISTESSNQTEPSITTLEDGSYIITWQNDDGISAHRFNEDGSEFHQSNFDMNEDSSITFNAAEIDAWILDNDYDAEGHDFHMTDVNTDTETNGEVTFTTDPSTGYVTSITFTPDEDYTGPATFEYTITDDFTANPATDTATVHLTVKPQGEPTIFVGTMCDADIHSHDIIVQEGEQAVLAVRISGAEANSTVSLTLADGTALVTEDYEAIFSYSFDGVNWTDYDSATPIVIPEGASKFAVKMQTVENTTNEPDENFTLSATLSTGESDTGTVTILDDDDLTPPVADAVLTTSNQDTDAIPNDFPVANVAFFKSIDIGGGLDGSSSENDTSDPADLGGSDAETTEDNLVFDITTLPTYGTLHIEIDGVYTEINASNLADASTLLSTADHVYWSATHDQVPANTDIQTIGGDYTSSGIEASWDNSDVTVIARSGDNTDASVTYNTNDGIGVRGANNSGVANQLGYDPVAKAAESIIFDFKNPVTDAEIAITHLIRGEGGGEIGTFEAFLDGESLGSFTFSNTVGAANYDLTAQSHGAGNSAGSNSGTLTIDDLVFDQLIFSAQEYVTQGGTVSDSSDYFIGGIEYHEVSGVEFEYQVIDADGMDSSDVKVVIDVETDTAIPGADTDDAIAYVADTAIDGGPGSDTLVISGNITLDFSDANIQNIENISLESGTTQSLIISLDDVLAMTDGNNALDITSLLNEGDTLTIKTADEDNTHTWTADVGNDGDFSNGETYSNGSGDSITLTVDETIDQTIM